MLGGIVSRVDAITLYEYRSKSGRDFHFVINPLIEPNDIHTAKLEQQIRITMTIVPG